MDSTKGSKQSQKHFFLSFSSNCCKDDVKQPDSESFIGNNSEPIIDFNFNPQFNRLTCEINDSNNFDSTKQIDGENNNVIQDSNKRNDNNNNNSSEQSNDGDNDFAIIQMKNLIENVKYIQATYRDVFSISDTLQSKDTENISVMYCQGSTTTQSQHERRDYSHCRRLHNYLALRN